MNYEALLKLSREKAEADAARLYPPDQLINREAARCRLVVKYYLDYISPIVVDEARS